MGDITYRQVKYNFGQKVIFRYIITTNYNYFIIFSKEIVNISLQQANLITTLNLKIFPWILQFLVFRPSLG
jgi:hypothetical protein